MQRQIKFIASGSSQVTGNFAPGDLLRCSAEMAHHLVEEVGCARYTDGGAESAAPAGQGNPTKPRAQRKTTAKDQA